MTARVLWHGRDVGTLGADSPAEIAHRCIVEDLTAAQEEAMAGLLEDDTAEDLVWGLVTERFKDWSTLDFLAPLVEEALDHLVDNPTDEFEHFTLGLPEERVFWWSVYGGGDLLPVEGATPETLAEAMVRMDRRGAAHFAVYHYLTRVCGQPYLDLGWEGDLARGLWEVDGPALRERVADILGEHWDELLGRRIVMGGNRDSGDLFILGNGPEERSLPRQTPSTEYSRRNEQWQERPNNRTPATNSAPTADARSASRPTASPSARSAGTPCAPARCARSARARPAPSAPGTTPSSPRTSSSPTSAPTITRADAGTS